MATTEPSSTSIIDAHRQATTAPLDTVARTLQNLLSRRLTAVIVGVKDTKTIGRWADGESDEIRGEDKERRLRTAYQIAVLLLGASNSPQTVKAWFIGLNPELNDISPAEAIRDDRLQEALSAARAFAAEG
jgi:hypothetical protein